MDASITASPSSKPSQIKSPQRHEGLPCVCQRTQCWNEPSPACALPAPLCQLPPASLLTHIHQRARQGTGCSTEKHHLPRRLHGAQRHVSEVTHLFQCIVTEILPARKHCPDLQQWDLGSWPDWKVGSPHHSPGLTVSCPFSSSLSCPRGVPSGSTQRPRTRLPPAPAQVNPAPGRGPHQRSRLSSLSFSIFFPKLGPQACGGMAFPRALVTGLGSCD